MPAEQNMLAVKYACGMEPSLANKTGDWRFLTPVRQIRPSPCRLACRLESEIPQWLEAVKRECWEEAWQIISRENPFPAITGHVCFHPCMDECNRNLLDQGLDIRAVERAVGERRLERYRPAAAPRPVRGRSVAVAGSGPAGLSCAYYLNRAGFAVTVFDRAPVAGGLLALGIPEYRLPRAVLSRELQILAEEGVCFELNRSLGGDLSAAQLAEEFDAVFFATGAARPRPLTVPGAELPGVWSALKFLKRVNLGEEAALKGPVAVIGGGNAAVDAARMALRRPGVEEVTVFYRRSRKEMPATAEEVGAAEEEGIWFTFNATPRALQESEGRLGAVLLDRTETGGGAIKILPGEPFIYRCGSLIYALGQEPDYTVFGKLPRPVVLTAGGDLVGGPATVPEAIRAGRVAAAAIAARLDGGETAAEKKELLPAVTFEELNLAALPNAHLKKRLAAPQEEAGRCLGCGTCSSCGLCELYCPDVAVETKQGQFTFNLDYCKGCGICARECPARVLVMEGRTAHAG